MKELIAATMEAVSTMVARSVVTSDVAYLKMKNKELSLNLEAVEAKNRRLVDLDVVRPSTRANTVDSVAQTDAALTSVSGTVLTAPSDPDVAAMREFSEKMNRFKELKAEMTQQLEDMSGIALRYSTVVENSLPVAITHNSSTSVSASGAVATPNVKNVPHKKSAGLVVTSDVKFASPMFESIDFPVLMKSAAEDSGRIQMSRAIKLKKRKRVNFEESEENLPTVNLPTVNLPGRKSPTRNPFDAYLPVVAPKPIAVHELRKPSAGIDKPIASPVRKRKVLNKAAVLITASSEDFSYASALKAARENISLKDIGINDRTSVRKAANGGTIIEISGSDGADKADILAAKLSKILTGAQVRRPVKKGEIRLVGLDDSVTPEEVKYTLADLGAVRVDSVVTSAVQKMTNGLGVAWVSMPIDAALKVAKMEKIRLGWSMIRIELLRARPTQCFKCWQFGHLRYSCKSTVDRSNHCFKCGHAGHSARSCTASPCCVLCKKNELPSAHRIGSVQCYSVPGGTSSKDYTVRRPSSSTPEND